MKKWTMALAAALALVVGTLFAAEINNLNGQTCETGGSWHFVNNQTGGAAAGTLTATWSSGDVCVTGPGKVLSSTQHFICDASGTLASASTNLPGKLVLSDFTCDGPPKCDPKTQKC